MTLLPGQFAAVTGFLTGQSALPGMMDCALFDAQGHRLATLSLRQAPTSADELAVVVDEVFQGDRVAEGTIGLRPGFLIECSHLWPSCRPAVAVVREPYMLVISVEPGQGDLTAARALATSVVGLLFP